ILSRIYAAARNLFGIEPREPLGGSSRLQDLGGEREALFDIADSAHRRRKAFVIDPLRMLERAAHPLPFRVGNHARGNEAILRFENQVAPDLAEGTALVVEESMRSHRLGPQERDHRI